MPNYTVTLTDAEDKAMKHIAVSVQEWIDNAVKARAEKAMNVIYEAEVERMNADSSITTIPADKNQVILDADIKTAEQINNESTGSAS